MSACITMLSDEQEPESHSDADEDAFAGVELVPMCHARKLTFEPVKTQRDDVEQLHSAGRWADSGRLPDHRLLQHC